MTALSAEPRVQFRTSDPAGYFWVWTDSFPSGNPTTHEIYARARSLYYGGDFPEVTLQGQLSVIYSNITLWERNRRLPPQESPLDPSSPIPVPCESEVSALEESDVLLLSKFRDLEAYLETLECQRQILEERLAADPSSESLYREALEENATERTKTILQLSAPQLEPFTRKPEPSSPHPPDSQPPQETPAEYLIPHLVSGEIPAQELF